MKALLDRIKPDHLGIISASLCLIHCILLPFLFGMYVDHHHDGHTHIPGVGIDSFFLGLGTVAVYFSSKHTSVAWIRYLMWASLGLLAFAIFMESTSEIFAYVLYAASFLLVIAHVINLRKGQKVQEDCSC
ncbi:MAG: MerC domain-containing protein [Bacteroidota bacterium]